MTTTFEDDPRWCPRQDSNLRSRFRKPMLYPLSYEGIAHRTNLGPIFGTFEILR